MTTSRNVVVAVVVVVVVVVVIIRGRAVVIRCIVAEQTETSHSYKDKAGMTMVTMK